MTHDKFVIYHNPGCSKSRETLRILENNNINATVIEYLDEPPSVQELKTILELLGVSARALLRTTEPAFEDAGLDSESLSEDEIITAICEHPVLLQRPIVIAGDRAVIGRPPDRVLDIIA